MNAGELIRDVSLRLAERTDDADAQGWASDLNQALDTLAEARIPLDFDTDVEYDERVPTTAQTLTVARLMRDFECTHLRVETRPFGLPTDHMLAIVRPRSGGELHFGIAPNGEASS